MRSEPPRPRVVISSSSLSPWKPATTAISPVVEGAPHALGGDPGDAGPGVGAVGAHADLGPGEGARLEAEGVQGHGEERDGHLLAGGQQHVHLARIGRGGDVLGEGHEPIGGLAHGRHHDDQAVPAARAPRRWPRPPPAAPRSGSSRRRPRTSRRTSGRSAPCPSKSTRGRPAGQDRAPCGHAVSAGARPHAEDSARALPRRPGSPARAGGRSIR